MPNRNSLSTLMRLMQLSDSALPIGGFSFSCAIESAVEYGLVKDQDSLREYVMVAARQTATCDSVAAIAAHRAFTKGDMQQIEHIDREVLLRKANAEQRTMTLRMGRKLCELSAEISGNELLAQLREMILSDRMEGTLPVVQGAVVAAIGADERELFAMTIYGTTTMMLSAALRCMRTTHRQTQQILYTVGGQIDSLYDQVRGMDLEQIYTFAPEIDLMAALHEKAQKRLFMN